MPNEISKYFPLLTETQMMKFGKLHEIYARWNSMINVISRKDMDNFMVHHVLHSLAVARVFSFLPGTTVLDVGTGGGFPGIPLAIIFPGSRFTLLDSIARKIRVVEAVTQELQLENVIPLRARAEEEKRKYNFVLSRAVTEFPAFVKLTQKNVAEGISSGFRNGIICLKGGDLSAELGRYHTRVKVWNISDFFEESFFETKKIVYLAS